MPNNRYFIIRREQLAELGNMHGSESVKEVNELLKNLDDPDIVVIKGIEMPVERSMSTRLLGS